MHNADREQMTEAGHKRRRYALSHFRHLSPASVICCSLSAHTSAIRDPPPSFVPCLSHYPLALSASHHLSAQLCQMCQQIWRVAPKASASHSSSNKHSQARMRAGGCVFLLDHTKESLTRCKRARACSLSLYVCIRARLQRLNTYIHTL